MNTTKIAAVLAASIALSGCVGSTLQYESTPVVLQSPKGPVTCQLYTREQVLWDRSIARPTNMGVTEADNICIREGRRQQKERQ